MFQSGMYAQRSCVPQDYPPRWNVPIRIVCPEALVVGGVDKPHHARLHDPISDACTGGMCAASLTSLIAEIPLMTGCTTQGFVGRA
jgi:hypothetical protein